MPNTEQREKLNNITLLIPCFNPDELLVKTVESMIEEGFSDILLINDGSDKDHSAPFEEAARHSEVRVEGYGVNRGKGCALKYGMRIALEGNAGLAGVVTCDGEGRYSARDTARVALALLASPEKLIMGSRNFGDPSVPLKIRAGNKISSFIFRFVYGQSFADTQTGLRGIPAQHIPALLEIEGEHLEYESNILASLNKLGIDYEDVFIDTVYIEDKRRSWFNIINDFYCIYKPVFIYALNSIMSCLLDLASFTIIDFALANTDPNTRILTATIVSRVLSSAFNYIVNRRRVFKSDTSVGKSAARFFILSAVKLCLSYLGVSALIKLFHTHGFGDTFMKLIVDGLLCVASYIVQRRWVFKK